MKNLLTPKKLLLGFGALILLSAAGSNSQPKANISQPSTLTTVASTIATKTSTPEPVDVTPQTTVSTVPTPAPAHKPAPTPEPVTAPQPASNCDPNYSPCIPNTTGDALNCGDIQMQVRVIGTDHNRFDRDHDGYGCESYN